jgi:hypothetical protein
MRLFLHSVHENSRYSRPCRLDRKETGKRSYNRLTRDVSQHLVPAHLDMHERTVKGNLMRKPLRLVKWLIDLLMYENPSVNSQSVEGLQPRRVFLPPPRPAV